MHESSYFIELDQLDENPANPRKRLNPVKDQELRDSICAVGIVQALLVRPMPQENGDPRRFQVVAGNRRLRAARAAGLVQVPCRVVEFNDQEALEAALTENAQRDDVHPLDEAEGFKALLDTGYDIGTVAMKLGKTARFVAQRIALLSLTPRLRELFERELLTLGIVTLIARHSTADQEAFVEQYDLTPEEEQRAGKWFLEEEPVRADDVKRFFEHRLTDLARAAWDLADAQLLPVAGACITCPKRTGSAGALFDDMADSCLDTKCFKEKQAIHIDRARGELTEKAKEFVELVTNRPQKDQLRLYDVRHVPEDEKTKRCKNVRPALIVDGPGAGKTLNVCTNDDCPVHRVILEEDGSPGDNLDELEEKRAKSFAAGRNSEADQKWKAEQAKRQKAEKERKDTNRKEGESRLAMLKGMLAKPHLGRTDVTRAITLLVAEELIDRLPHGAGQVVAKVLGLEPAKPPKDFHTREIAARDAVRAALPGIAREGTEAEINAALAALLVAYEVHINEYAAKAQPMTRLKVLAGVLGTAETPKTKPAKAPKVTKAAAAPAAAKSGACKCKEFTPKSPGSDVCTCDHLEEDHDIAGAAQVCLMGHEDVDFNETPAKASKAKPKTKKEKTPPPPRGKKAAAAAEAGQ